MSIQWLEAASTHFSRVVASCVCRPALSCHFRQPSSQLCNNLSPNIGNMSTHRVKKRLHLTLLLGALLLMHDTGNKKNRVHDTILDFANIHFVVTKECGHLKYTLSDGKSHKSRNGMQRLAPTHILSPGGSALGRRREMSSLAGVDRVCMGIMRGREKKASSFSSTSAARDSWKEELMVNPSEKLTWKSWAKLLMCDIWGWMGRIWKRKRPTKICLWRITKTAWNHNPPKNDS